MVVQVEISELEYKWASYAGILRNEDSIQKGRRHAYGLTNYTDENVVGAVGEFIASLVIGVPWRGPGTFQGEDLVGGYQVRASKRLNADLTIRPKDPNDAIYILVVGGPLKWQVPGWILGKDGKQKEFWDDPTYSGRPSAYFVPQLALKSIKDLTK